MTRDILSVQLQMSLFLLLLILSPPHPQFWIAMKREEDDGWHQKCLSGSLNFEGSEGHWLDWVGTEAHSVQLVTLLKFENLAP